MKRVSTMVLPAVIALGVAGFNPPDAYAQDFPHPRDMVLPRAQFVMPDTLRHRLVLENGIIGYVIPDGTVPLVTYTAFVRAGRGDDRTPGVAEMLLLMMQTRGPCWMPPGRFARTIDSLAAEFRVNMGPEITEITLNVASEDAREGLRLFSGIVREPCIDAEGLEAFRRRVAAGEERARRSTGPIAYEGSLDDAVQLFEAELLGDHPYVHRVTLEEAAALTLEEVERFHRDYVVPGQLTLAVSGAFDLPGMVAAVDQRFADWQPRRPRRLAIADEVRTAVPGRRVGYPADKGQTWVVIGHELPVVPTRDWPALEVMNYVVGGGHFDTRLFRETRDKRGLTNDASGFLVPRDRGPGTYTFRTYGRPEVAEQLIEIVRAEIETIRQEPVDVEELEVAKGALADGAFPILFENGHTTARTFALEWTRFASLERLAQYPDAIRDVDVRDVQRAAERYLHPDRLLIVTLGPEIP